MTMYKRFFAGLILYICFGVQGLKACPESDSIILCEGFETEEIEAGLSYSNDKSISLTNKQRYSGDQALKIDALGGGYNANFIEFNMLENESANTHHFGRAMIYLMDKNSFTGDATIIQAEGPLKPQANGPVGAKAMFRGRLDGRHDHLFSNYDTFVAAAKTKDANTENDADGTQDAPWQTDCWKHPEAIDSTPKQEYVLDKNTWVCLEWEFNAESNKLDFMIDGQKLNQISIDMKGDGCIGQSQNDIWYGPSRFEIIKIGLEQYHTSTKPRTMYVDDIVISKAAIGCAD